MIFMRTLHLKIDHVSIQNGTGNGLLIETDGVDLNNLLFTRHFLEIQFKVISMEPILELCTWIHSPVFLRVISTIYSF